MVVEHAQARNEVLFVTKIKKMKTKAENYWSISVCVQMKVRSLRENMISEG